MAISDTAFWCRKVEFSLLAQDGTTDVIRTLDSSICVRFNIEKTRTSEPNKAEIQIANLSQDTRNRIMSFSADRTNGEFTRIRLTAGYAPNGVDRSDVIFDGYIRRVWHGKERTEFITNILAGDGDLDYRNATVNQSWPKGTPYRTIVNHIRSRMPNIGAGNLSGVDKMGVTDKGYTIAGWAKRYLDEITRKHDTRWSIQNGLLEIVCNNEAIQRTIPRIRPAIVQNCEIIGGSGMIGVPVVTETGINIVSLLIPSIRPNVLIDVESRTRDLSANEILATETDAGAGLYRVNNVSYRGSNFDNEFYVLAECQRYTGGSVRRALHNGDTANA